MATLRSPAMHLPACVLLGRQEALRAPATAARAAMQQLETIRGQNRPTWAASGSPSPASVNSAGLSKGVLKIGWSWEAKFVWFWRGEAQLAEYLKAMLELPGCTADFCLVQEWVDFDFELRLFFLPPHDWAPGAPLAPVHHEYTAWKNAKDADAPQTFLKPSEDEVLSWVSFAGDELALASAHRQAIDASQPLIAELFKLGARIPMVRLDWMVKRRGPGLAQVVFGEYCEMGACCLKWEAGPPRIWRAALDVALLSD